MPGFCSVEFILNPNLETLNPELAGVSLERFTLNEGLPNHDLETGLTVRDSWAEVSVHPAPCTLLSTLYTLNVAPCILA